MDGKLEQLREIVAEVLEVEPEAVLDTADFRDKYDADSMRAIEILSRIEKRFNIEIPQHELPRMLCLKAVYEVVNQYGA